MNLAKKMKRNIYITAMLLVVNFLFFTTRTYTQNINCFEEYKPFYLFSGKASKVYYIDSSLVNGTTVYSDSITVNVAIAYTDSIVAEGVVVYTDSSVTGHTVTNYPIGLKNDFPFKKAFFRDDYCGFWRGMTSVSIWLERVNTNKSDDKSGICIFSSDNKYIKYALIENSDKDLYDKYNPLQKNDKKNFSFSEKQFYNKMINWVRDKALEGSIVSIGKKKKKYIIRLFDSNE